MDVTSSQKCLNSKSFSANIISIWTVFLKVWSFDYMEKRKKIIRKLVLATIVAVDSKSAQEPNIFRSVHGEDSWPD